MATAGLRPSEVARRLGVSPATLRRWSQQFGEFLSNHAGYTTAKTSGRSHRRYTEADVAILEKVKFMLQQQGLTYEEARQHFVTVQTSEPAPEPTSEPMPAPAAEPAPDVFELVAERNDETALVSQAESAHNVPDLAVIIADTLTSLSDSQQIILGGQQTERQLLGVVLQDNFNLKEENRRLRERMVETERRVYELRRELDKERREEKERMRQMESYLFELQRRVDSLTEPVIPHPTQPATPLEYFPPNPAYPADQSESEMAPYETPWPQEEDNRFTQKPEAPRKRRFWDWLFGR